MNTNERQYTPMKKNHHAKTRRSKGEEKIDSKDGVDIPVCRWKFTAICLWPETDRNVCSTLSAISGPLRLRVKIFSEKQ
jgi:hypothetical protein